ncbi:MAG: IPT/TIG domain-containing protein, partial [Proteobacteria bacterium]|nr:IPT/TIG domain-containing protein [Pseudomonadota bacterium]
MLAITRWVVAFAMLLGTTSAFAQTYTYSVYVDTDNNAATGCAVTLPNGSFTGVESVLTATVNAGSPPTVASVTRSTCSAGSFGAAVSEGVGAVSVGAGTGGTTSIELGDALASLGASPTQTLRFYVVSRSAAGDDVLLTTNGDPAGSPIVLALTQFAPVPAPYAGLPTLLLLGGILLLFGSRAARRKTMKRLMLGLVLVSGVAGAGIFNWNLVSMLATDPAGDTTSGESALDLRYFYATLGGSTLEFRLDVAGNLAIVAPPAVTSIAPTAGPLTAGTSVIITGTNFTATTAVKFGGTNATMYTINSATRITATAPAGGAGTVDVTVTTVAGTSATSAADQFTYVAPPTVSGVAPTVGPTSGGTTVIITGTNLSGASAVKFGGTNAAAYTVNSATQITATSPAGAAGTVDVTVTTVGGTSATSSADQYTYTPAPAVTAINPTSGPTAGNTTVIITGSNFSGASAVKFGGTNATTYTVNSATQITATSPASAAGTVDITVTTVGGTSATGAPDQFTYVAPPTVTGIAPTAGPLAGGTSVTITGTNLTGASAVKFGATPAGSFTLVSATQIMATAPAGTGVVDVTVTTVGGTSATGAPDQFTYVPLPTVTAINPTVGPTSGGTTVIITGTNLSGASAVTFGGNNAASYTVNSATQITAISPAGAAGTVNITVTTMGGTSATSSADQYTYTPAPAVTAIAPASGPTAGGT